jgi:hypothetical protein
LDLGINLYATVAALGIANRLEMIQLPQNLEVLSHPGVIAIACIMYFIEFFADKVPTSIPAGMRFIRLFACPLARSWRRARSAT